MVPPPPPPTNIDELLRTYIGESSTTLKHITDQLNMMDKKFDLHVQDDAARFRGIESRLTTVEEDQETTDRHNIARLEKELEEKKALEREAKVRDETRSQAEQDKRKDMIIKAIGYAIVVIVSIAIGFLGRHLFFK